MYHKTCFGTFVVPFGAHAFFLCDSGDVMWLLTYNALTVVVLENRRDTVVLAALASYDALGNELLSVGTLLDFQFIHVYSNNS